MFRLTIQTDNAAFHEQDGRQTSTSLGVEVARILRELAYKRETLDTEGDEGPCFDVTGNKVGTWRLT